ncbi:MAG TPA: 50S ribosomal protein L14e [Candidatus Altiarchaeales archaeon]|nr:50S ribosomal protein L14e [Candidatus Altiarchaeales archaeon]
MILSVGRVCMKVKGREAGKYCVIVDKPEKNFVLIDGRDVKRRKVNIRHLEPLPVVLKIKRNADTKTVEKALEKEGF